MKGAALRPAVAVPAAAGVAVLRAALVTLQGPVKVERRATVKPARAVRSRKAAREVW